MIFSLHIQLLSDIFLVPWGKLCIAITNCSGDGCIACNIGILATPILFIGLGILIGYLVKKYRR
jgi:hypothetical protein